MIIPVTHKRLLEIQTFEKKEVFPVKKKFWLFSRSKQHDKYQGTICKGPQGILTITVELIRSIL